MLVTVRGVGCRGARQVHSKVDDVNGVSACIILGSPMEVGTGCLKLLHQQRSVRPVQRRTLMLDVPITSL